MSDVRIPECVSFNRGLRSGFVLSLGCDMIPLATAGIRRIRVFRQLRTYKQDFQVHGIVFIPFSTPGDAGLAPSGGAHAPVLLVHIARTLQSQTKATPIPYSLSPLSRTANPLRRTTLSHSS
jgi:hypothetical protein